MIIKSKYDVGDTVFVIEYNPLIGQFNCFDHIIKSIIYDGTEIIYGFIYDIQVREKQCYEGKLEAKRTCDLLNSQLDWSE